MGTYSTRYLAVELSGFKKQLRNGSLAIGPVDYVKCTYYKFACCLIYFEKRKNGVSHCVKRDNLRVFSRVGFSVKENERIFEFCPYTAIFWSERTRVLAYLSKVPFYCLFLMLLVFMFFYHFK